MLRNIFLKTLRDMRKALFWWSLCLFLLSLYYMALYPTVRDSGEDFQEMFNNMPEAIKAMIGSSEFDFTSLGGYLSAEAFSFFYPLMLLAFGITYGAGFIGSEEENGTLDLMLSTPIPRWRYVIEKFGALIVFTLLVSLAIYAGFVIGGIMVGVDDMPLGDLLLATLNMMPLTLFFAALALFLTGIKGGRGSALGIVLGLAAITYLLHTMADIADIPGWLQRLSPWYYYNGAEAMKEGLNAGYVGLLIGLTALLVGLGMWGLERRDVGV